MDGKKLELVKQTLASIVGTLSEGDSFGLVCFGSEVSVRVPFSPFEPDQAGRILAAIDSLEATGATALCGGLARGIEQLKSSPHLRSLDLATLLLFTDGVANVGTTRVAKIIESLQLALPDVHDRPLLCTFGIGAETQTDLLAALAEECRGQYVCVAEEESIPRALLMSVAAARSVRFRDVELLVEVQGGAVLNAVASAALGTSFAASAQGSARFELGRMGEQQHRNLLIVVSVPPCEAEVQAVLRCSLAYRDGRQGGAVVCSQEPIVATVRRGTVPVSERTANIEVTNQLNRMRMSLALSRAAALGRMNDWAAAAALLQETSQTIKESGADNDCTQVFLDDLAMAEQSARSHPVDPDDGSEPDMSAAPQHVITTAPLDYGIMTEMARAHREERPSIHVPAYSTEVMDAFLTVVAGPEPVDPRRRSLRIRGPALASVPAALTQAELDAKLGHVQEDAFGIGALTAGDRARLLSAEQGAERSQPVLDPELREQLASRAAAAEATDLREPCPVEAPVAVAEAAPQPTAVFFSPLRHVAEETFGAATEDKENSVKPEDEAATEELKNRLKRVRDSNLGKEAGSIDAELDSRKKKSATATAASCGTAIVAACESCPCTAFQQNPFRPTLCLCQHSHRPVQVSEKEETISF